VNVTAQGFADGLNLALVCCALPLEDFHPPPRQVLVLNRSLNLLVLRQLPL
jgi:hypothetical protein